MPSLDFALTWKRMKFGIAMAESSPMMQALRIRNSADNNRGETGAIWMLLSRNPAFLANDAIRRAATPPASADFGEPAWTDDYANVLGALDLGGGFP